MKHLILTIVFVGLLPTLTNAATPTTGKSRSIPLKERKAMMAERMRRLTGGFVVKPGVKGKILYVNGQERVPATEIQSQISMMAELMSVKIEMVQGEKVVKPNEATTIRKKLGANAAIYFVDDSTMTDTMLLAPESGWGIVNLAALAADNPEPAKLRMRVIREIWRTYAMLLGASDSVQPKCIMRPVMSLGDLDKLHAETFCPEPLDKIVAHLRAIGVDASQRKTYRQACKEGWAPAPTNDYQKAIWDEFHQIPTKPMKIEFNPKTGK